MPDFESLDRIGKKSASKLLATIEKSKRNALWRVLFGIGIRHVGERAAQALARNFGTITALRVASVDELEKVRDIGPIVASSVRAFFDKRRNCDLIDRLLKVGVLMEGTLKINFRKTILFDQTFVLTGTLSLISRDKARQTIESLGGKVVSSVSKQTSFVVAGDRPGGKLAIAKGLGIQILNEKTFLETIMKGRRP